MPQMSRRQRTRRRNLVAVAAGAVTLAVAFAAGAPWPVAVSAGWAAIALMIALAVWPRILRMDPEQTKANARDEDFSRLTGDFELGNRHFERALEIRRTARDQRETATTLTGMGMLALAAGERARGLELFDRAQAIYVRTEDAPGLEGLPLNLGAFELDGGDPEQARVLFERSVSLTGRRSGLQRLGC